MAYYGLGQQGWYNAWANAGEGMRRTLGEALGIYDRYKPQGLEAQRRAELLLAQQKGASDIGLQGAETAGMRQQQQQGADTFDYQRGFRPQPGAPPPPVLGGQPNPPPTPAMSNSDVDGQLPDTPTSAPVDLNAPVTGSVPGAVGAAATSAALGQFTPTTEAPQKQMAVGGGVSTPAPPQLNSVTYPADGDPIVHPRMGEISTRPLDPMGTRPGKTVGGPQDESTWTQNPGEAFAAPPSAPAGTPLNSAFPVNMSNYDYAKSKNWSRLGTGAAAAADLAKNSFNALPNMAVKAAQWLSAPVNGTTPAPPSAPSVASAAVPEVAPQVVPPAPPTAAAPTTALAELPPETPPLAAAPMQPTQTPVQPSRGPLLWNELSPDQQAQQTQAWLAHNPQIGQAPGGVAAAYNANVQATTGSMRRPATEQDIMQAVRLGIDPNLFIHNGILDPLAEAKALQPAYQALTGVGSGSSSTLSDDQGVPYAKIIPIFNPMTGAYEMKQVEIPKEARRTASGLPQGVLTDITGYGDTFMSQELPKTFYGEIAPKYQSIVNLLGEAKKTGDYNQFRSMDALNAYAGIARPGSVVRDSTIEMDFKGSGVVNEMVRKWYEWIKGAGTMSKKDLSQIASSARDSYNGYKVQVEQAQVPVVKKAQVRSGLDPQTIKSLLFPPVGGEALEPSGSAAESAPSTSQIRTVNSPEDAKKLPSGTVFIYKGQQYTRQ
jgi:hypothetical protein